MIIKQLVCIFKDDNDNINKNKSIDYKLDNYL